MSCHSNNPIPKDTIIIGIEKTPENFDPRLPKDATSQKINKLVYSSLLKKDNNLKLVPDIAKSYLIKNPLTYIFYLRDNVFFHNKKKLTSKDVKATYESLLGDKIKTSYKSRVQIIKSIETPDEYTVIFKLKKIHTPFLSLMTIGILPRSHIILDGQPPLKNKQTLYGTGPYTIAFDKITLNSLTLKRFDDYFADSAKTKTLIFRVVQDNTLRALEFIKGRIDLIQNNVPFVMIPFLKEKKEFKFETSPGINFSYMAFNLKNKYLKNKNVRKAIALAIDRKKIIKYKLAGMGEPATSLLSPSHWVYNGSLIPYEYDLKKAKALLDQTPFKDPDGDGPLPRFKLIYKTSSVKERVEIAQLIAENLKKIGIEVTVKSYEFGTFYRDVRQGDFDLYTLTWVGITDPDIYFEIFHSEKFAPTGFNRGFYTNKDLDKMLNQSRIETDPEKSKELYNKIQDIVYQDFVYAPLWHEVNFVFMKKNVFGYSLRPDANFINLIRAYKD